MPSNIIRQTTASDVSTSDWLPVWDTSAGDTQRVNVEDVVAYIRASIPAGLSKYEQLLTTAEPMEDSITNPSHYAFDDIQNNSILYLRNMSVWLYGVLTVSLPPNPIDGQEVTITLDGIEITIDFPNDEIADDSHSKYFYDTEMWSPAIRFKYNGADEKWWIIGDRWYGG